jgi:hypothetical protein
MERARQSHYFIPVTLSHRSPTQRLPLVVLGTLAVAGATGCAASFTDPRVPAGEERSR